MASMAAKRTLSGAVTGLSLLALLAACGQRELILPGERFDTRTPLEASVPVEGQPEPVAPPDRAENISQPISLPGASANADWTHRAGNNRHSAPHGALSASPQRVWTANIGAGSTRRNRIVAAPIVADGRIYTIDGKSGLVATSTSGGQLWATDLAAQFDRGGNVSGGGLAYAGGRLFAATGFGEIVALDPASGAVIWRQRFDAPVMGAPSVDNGVVYVGGRDGAAFALTADSGKILWDIPGTPNGVGMVGAAGPAVADSTVLFPTAGGEVTAVLKDGTARNWLTSVAGKRLGRVYATIADVTGDPVIAGGTTYVGTSAGRTVALDTESGKLLWSAGEGALAPVLAVGGSVFLVNDEARLVRLDASTGDVIWNVEMPYFVKEKVKKRKAITAHYGPVLAGGRLVVASGDGILRFFNPTDGALVSTLDLPGGAAAQPALAGGVLYVVSNKGQLHAFR
jgi:outer membrane protein assembly factor BamB